MCNEKECTCTSMVKPVICGMVAGMAVFGIGCLVLCMTQKGRNFKHAMKEAGCDCIDSMCDKASDLMEEGADAMQNLKNKCDCALD